MISIGTWANCREGHSRAYTDNIEATGQDEEESNVVAPGLDESLSCIEPQRNDVLDINVRR